MTSMNFPGDGTLDQVKPPQGDVAMNSHKLTGLANGVASTDAATVGQLPSGAAAVPLWAASTAYTAYQRVILPTGGKGYRATAGTSRSTFDATERAAWTFEAGGHAESLAAGVTAWVCPAGITQARFRLTGAGGSGGAAGSDALTSGIGTQVGGGGGGAGQVLEAFITGLTAATSYVTAIGSGGAAPAGGAASSGATGNAGANGSQGGNTTITIGAVTYTALGGSRGSASAAKSTTSVGGGLPAAGAARSSTTAGIPGMGGTASTSSGSYSLALGSTIGGGGGAPSTATPKGGAGGNAATSPGMLVDVASGTPTATAAGANGTTATVPGCGGGGGGGGGAGGAGGNGGAGADGQIAISF
ncbi:hypothetical protein [Jatrophihabitans sp.]|uniref:hypothetical protein n=1 Tax=Jatrophihabitans sp. TaxID=1932789 RepID=UPI0030C6BCF8|nr:hypothetical protein [Jatrophihabitans sp.]